MDADLQELADAIRQVREMLAKYANQWADDRLAALENELSQGNAKAIISAFSEATGSMGSLNDRYIHPNNGDLVRADEVVAANDLLRRGVERIEALARNSAAARNIDLAR